MTTEERVENLERELARANRRNRWLVIGAAMCLGMIFAWAFLAQPGPLGTAQASDPANPYEAEITKLQAEVNLLKRENERLRKELDQAKKEKSAAAPTDAQGPSAPQPTADRIPGLPETDSSWWRDPVALARHVQLRVAMSATKPQASVWMWLQRNNYFAEQPLQWDVFLDNGQDGYMRFNYVDKDSASTEYYKCLSELEKIGKEAETYSKEGVSNDDLVKTAEREDLRAAWFRGEAKAWKMLMDAGGGISLRGGTTATQEEADLPVFRVHLVLPGGGSKAYAAFPGIAGQPISRNVLVRVQGKIIALGAIPKSAATSAGLPHLQAALTGRVTILSKSAAPPRRETLEEHEAGQRALEGRPAPYWP